MFKIENFKILKQIGKGQFGTVSKVENIKDGKIYALKTIQKDLKNKKELLAIGEEMVISQSLKYKYIVNCYGTHSDDKNFYLFFEYGENGDLDNVIKFTEKGFSEATVKKIAKDILQALDYCHYNRICHKDLKPANILVFNSEDEKEKYTYKLADFGLSQRVEGKREDELCISGFCGSLYYMAPEIFETRDEQYRYETDSNIDPEIDDPPTYLCDKADIWALGITLAYALTKNRPFTAKTTYQLIDKIRYDKPDLKGISEDAQAFILKLLEKNPRYRLSPEEALTEPWLK